MRKTVLLLNGKERVVKKTHYQYGRDTCRIEYECPESETGSRGCIAEQDDYRFTEVEKPTYRKYDNG